MIRRKLLPSPGDRTGPVACPRSLGSSEVLRNFFRKMCNFSDARAAILRAGYRIGADLFLLLRCRPPATQEPK